MIVDTHLHCYRNFSGELFARYFLNNLGGSNKIAGVFTKNLAASIQDDHNQVIEFFAQDKNYQIQSFNGGVFCANFVDKREIYFYFGMQLQSAEKLEALVFTPNFKNLPTGLSFLEMVARALDQVPLLALPWSFGKWFGSRGKLILEALNKHGVNRILFVDHPSRFEIFLRCPVFSLAQESGVRIIAGSDPLPFSGEEKRVGSFGSKITFNKVISERQPFQELLSFPDITFEVVGKRLGLFQTLRSQCRLRLNLS
ncbi:MAG TPA: hypothetical protein PKD37_00820 [Oligoflexia bacterium]|nr:hypothetical protein [Oligoflexia bacterium]HMP26522.1 hypothetical protein [Oligoflexia bacterium]